MTRALGAMIVAFVVAAPVAANEAWLPGDAPNLVWNASFEDDAGGWVELTGTRRIFHGSGDGRPDFWEPAGPGFDWDAERAHSGTHSIRLGAEGAGARWAQPRRWRLASTPAMLPAGSAIFIGAWSLSGDARNAADLVVTLGGESHVLPLDTRPGAWRPARLVIVPDDSVGLPQVEVRLTASAGGQAPLWVDDIFVGQRRDYPNLAANPGFEDGQGVPEGWSDLPRDTTHYWGGVYRPAAADRMASHWGRRSLMCAAAFGQIAGAAQRIQLNQSRAAPVQVGVFCRALNLVADDWSWLACELWYADGTQDIALPKVLLGPGAHGWDYRTFTIRPAAPLRSIVLKVEHKAALRTSVVWLDDVYVAEIGPTPAELVARRGRLPRPEIALGTGQAMNSRYWGADCGLSAWRGQRGWGSRLAEGPVVRLRHADGGVGVEVIGQWPGDGRLDLMFAPTSRGYPQSGDAAFYRVRVDREGGAALAQAYDEHGFVFYERLDLLPDECRASVGPDHLSLEVPFDALSCAAPAPGDVWGFNAAFGEGEDAASWAPGCDDVWRFGLLRFAGPRMPTWTALSFGEGLSDGLDMTDLWVPWGDVRWGENRFRAALASGSPPDGASVTLPGQAARVRLGAGAATAVNLRYQAQEPGFGELPVTVSCDTGSNPVVATTRFPIFVPPAISVNLDQRFYYPSESQARLEVRVNGAIPPSAPLTATLLDRFTGRAIAERRLRALPSGRAWAVFDISGLALSTEPVARYRCVVRAARRGETAADFGRLRPPAFERLPPVETVTTSDDGVLLVNGERVFPIVISAASLETYDRAARMGFNAQKHNIFSDVDTRERLDWIWAHNQYAVPCPFRTGSAANDQVVVEARDHPATLMYIGGEFTYGEFFTPRGLEQFAARRALDPRHPSIFEFQAGSGNWYGRRRGIEPYAEVVQLGALVTAGPLGRIVPRNFRLERAAAAPGELMMAVSVLAGPTRGEYLVPGQWFQQIVSLPAESTDQVRAATYLAIIAGARGWYLFDATDGIALDQVRGLALELRLLAPILAARDPPQTVRVGPPGSPVEVLLKEHTGKRYLIAANRSDRSVTADFRVPGLQAGDSVGAMFEPPREIERTKQGFRDRFASFAVHIYQVEGERQGG